jgi:hypothetical protein
LRLKLEKKFQPNEVSRGLRHSRLYASIPCRGDFETIISTAQNTIFLYNHVLWSDVPLVKAECPPSQLPVSILLPRPLYQSTASVRLSHFS